MIKRPCTFRSSKVPLKSLLAFGETLHIRAQLNDNIYTRALTRRYIASPNNDFPPTNLRDCRGFSNCCRPHRMVSLGGESGRISSSPASRQDL